MLVIYVLNTSAMPPPGGHTVVIIGRAGWHLQWPHQHDSCTLVMHRLPDIVLADGKVLKVDIQMKVDPGSISAAIEAKETKTWVTRTIKRTVSLQVEGQVQVCFRLRFTRGDDDDKPLGLPWPLAVATEAANLMLAAFGAAFGAGYAKMVGHSA